VQQGKMAAATLQHAHVQQQCNELPGCCLTLSRCKRCQVMILALTAAAHVLVQAQVPCSWPQIKVLPDKE
jgi:hypothetical protein